MYEFIKTENGWLLFWGPPPVVEIETVYVVAEDEVAEGELILVAEKAEWPAPMAV